VNASTGDAQSTKKNKKSKKRYQEEPAGLVHGFVHCAKGPTHANNTHVRPAPTLSNEGEGVHGARVPLAELFDELEYL
jgi:hypothetical protein